MLYQEDASKNLENNIVLEKNQRIIAEKLCVILATSYTLYLRTQNYHWNVRGSFFRSLHLLFEDQYKDLALEVDLVAERIRALGSRVPAAFTDFRRLSSLSDHGEIISAKAMVSSLILGQQELNSNLRQTVVLADSFQDFATADLMTQQMIIHEKAIWLLQSLSPPKADDASPYFG